MSPILSIALLDIETLELSEVSIRLVPVLNSVSLLTEATQDTGSASTAILAVLNKVTSNNLIFRSFDYFLQPILSEVKAYFSRVIPVEPPLDLAFLSTEIPLVYLLKGLNDSVASFSILSDIEVYKNITADVAETSEQEARVLLKRLNTEIASTLSYHALETLLKKEDVALTLSELSRTVNYNRPEFSNTQPDIVEASEDFNYLRPLRHQNILGFLENIYAAKSPAILEDTLSLESVSSFSIEKELNDLDSDLLISKAGRSHEGNWQGVGLSLRFYKDSTTNKIVLEDDREVVRSVLANELTVLQEAIKRAEYLSFTNPIAFKAYSLNSLNRIYTWTLDNTRERQESRVDLRAERRERNWDSVGPQFSFINNYIEQIEILEDILPAKAVLPIDLLDIEETTKRAEYLSFTNPIAFEGYSLNSLNRIYRWTLDNTRERQESRVDLRAERRERNWDSVGPQFDFLSRYYDTANAISTPLSAKAVLPIDLLDIEETTKRAEYLSFTSPIAFQGYRLNSLNRIYTWTLDNTRERQESRVDLRAERRERNWDSVGPQFDFLSKYYDTANAISLVIFFGHAKIATELLESIDINKKVFDISFVYPISFKGFSQTLIYDPVTKSYVVNSANLNRIYNWTLDNTRERQESRVDLRAERRERNWQGVGLKMSVPLRLPEQLIDFEELVIPTKAHYVSESIQIQHNQKKDIDLNFVSPTGPERLEEQVNIRLKNSLYIDKPLTLNLLTDSLFLLYRVPLFTQPIAVTQEVSDLEILLRKTEKVKIYANSSLDLTRNTFEAVNFISDTIIPRSVDSASVSEVSEHLTLLSNNNYKEALSASESFYRQAKYIRTPTDTVEVDATISGFAQDYSPAYFSQAYVGIAFLGE